jgi:hypothetical protein
MNRRLQSGYIFITTLIMLAMFSFMAIRMTDKVEAFVLYARTFIDRQKARQLALSGVQLGMSQLVHGMHQEGEQAEKETEQNQALRLLKNTVPYNGRLQTFALQRARDGVTGRIDICITCENAKIDLNALYDFSKGAFIGEGAQQGDSKKIMQELFSRLEEQYQAKNLFAAFEKYMKERKVILDDVTQLLTDPQLRILQEHIIYEPDKKDEKQFTQERKKRVYLTDLFTVWSGTRTIDPWLLTESIRALLGLQPIEDKPMDKALLPKTIKSSFDWQQDWNTLLAALYGKQYQDIPEFIRPLFATKFEPHTFSVLSYGKIGRVTQKVLAIVELRLSKQKEVGFDASIKKLYWL